MSNLLTGTVKAISLPEQDAELAKHSSDAIAHFTSPTARHLQLRLEDQGTGAQMEATVPGVVVKILSEALAKLAAGQSVTLVPLDAELSTQQAAEMMGVSRPYFIKLLERGEIPYRKVGEHRRLRYQDLLTYLDSYQRQATAALDEMSAEMQAMQVDDYVITSFIRE